MPDDIYDLYTPYWVGKFFYKNFKFDPFEIYNLYKKYIF